MTCQVLLHFSPSQGKTEMAFSREKILVISHVSILFGQKLKEHLLVLFSLRFWHVFSFSLAGAQVLYGINGRIGTLWRWLLKSHFFFFSPFFLKIKYNNFHSSRRLGPASCLPLWAFINFSLGSMWWIGCIYSLLGVCYVNMTHFGALRIHGLG